MQNVQRRPTEKSRRRDDVQKTCCCIAKGRYRHPHATTGKGPECLITHIMYIQPDIAK
jgi:hypothetical protein